MDAYDLIARDASEVVMEDEVRTLADDPEGKRAHVGYEPSDVLHIDHMLTANKLIDFQAAGFGVVVLLVNVHAYLNGKGTFEEIRETAERMKAQFITYDPDKSQAEFVLGSEYQLDESYALDLHAVELETTFSRVERAIAEIKSDDGITVAQAVYPTMQALDIVYLDVDLAIGGMEQRKVHILARDTLPSTGEESSIYMHTPLIADLGTGTGKMSSSEGVTTSMEDSTEDIEDKVNGVFCPPTTDPEPTDEGEGRKNPILQIFEYHVFPRFERVVVEHPGQYSGSLDYDDYETLEADLESGELHPTNVKDALADYLDELIEPGRAKVAE